MYSYTVSNLIKRNILQEERADTLLIESGIKMPKNTRSAKVICH